MTNLNTKTVASTANEVKSKLTQADIDKLFGNEKVDFQEALAIAVARHSIEIAERNCKKGEYESVLEMVKRKIFTEDKNAIALKKLCFSFGINPNEIPEYVLSRCWKDGKIK